MTSSTYQIHTDDLELFHSFEEAFMADREVLTNVLGIRKFKVDGMEHKTSVGARNAPVLLPYVIYLRGA